MSKELTIKVGEKFTLPNQKGKVMFKFDNDEPKEVMPFFENGKFTITLDSENFKSVEFENNGKKFALFIE
jgi:hypothetical protein